MHNALDELLNNMGQPNSSIVCLVEALPLPGLRGLKMRHSNKGALKNLRPYSIVVVNLRYL